MNDANEDAVESAVVQLRARRGDLLRQVERIDKAISLWTSGLSDTGTAGEAQPTRITGTQPKRRVVRRKGRGSSAVSVKSRVVALLDEADREWTAPEIVEEQKARGIPVHREGVADKASPVRTALLNATQQGLVVKLSTGRYKSARFIPTDDQSATTNEDPTIVGSSLNGLSPTERRFHT